MSAPSYDFTAPLRRHDTTKSSWWFVPLPPDTADEIADRVPHTGGFGSVRVHVRIGAATWSTSLFPSARDATYVLPVKKAVRQQEQLEEGALARVHLTLAD